jgi:uncharacterized NAD-dependent epimerase/dehydratase family protein
MDGKALILCEGAFDNTNGKTAHGLVRHTLRYEVAGVIDSRLAGRDAGEVLDGRPRKIPIFAGLQEALAGLASRPTHLVIGLAPVGGRLPESYRAIVAEALRHGLNVDSGLHQFLSDDPELRRLAEEHGVHIRDVRKPPPREKLHFFSGEIEKVRAVRVAVLGTDCAIGKRTTAVVLTEALTRAGVPSVLVGTGQTSWMQGVRYGLILDSLVNDFVAGELEHAVVEADTQESPRVIVVEGQGSLAHPAYPGGFEILGATRPRGVILQHAPGRRTYDGFPDYPLAPPEVHIRAIETLFRTRVIALSVNHQGIERDKVREVTAELERRHGLPCCDPLLQGAERLADAVRSIL